MLRRMSDMPAGTIGFEAVGEVEDDDWEQAVEPVLRREIADGRPVRLLYLLGPEAREVEGDAMSADAGFRARHATSFERVAVVSDEDWMRPALRALSFLLPGKARGFHVRELDAAKSWLADAPTRSRRPRVSFVRATPVTPGSVSLCRCDAMMRCGAVRCSSELPAMSRGRARARRPTGRARAPRRVAGRRTRRRPPRA